MSTVMNLMSGRRFVRLSSRAFASRRPHRGFPDRPASGARVHRPQRHWPEQFRLQPRVGLGSLGGYKIRSQATGHRVSHRIAAASPGSCPRPSYPMERLAATQQTSFSDRATVSELTPCRAFGSKASKRLGNRRRALGAVATAEPAVFWAFFGRDRLWRARREGEPSEKSFANPEAARAVVSQIQSTDACSRINRMMWRSSSA